MKIFIGSSTPGKSYARQISFIIRKENCQTLDWWDNDEFKRNHTIIENILDGIESCDAGIFLFTEDDIMVSPDKNQIFAPRDNVLFEYGMFVGRHGRSSCAIAKKGNPKLPSDLGGVDYISIEEGEDFQKNNEEKIVNWITALKKNEVSESNRKVKASLQKIADRYTDLKAKIRWIIESMDGRASVEYNERKVMVAMQGYLENGIAKSLLAVDVVGPQAWQTPSIYHYLAPQLREYLRANVSEGNKFALAVDHRLFNAINCGISNAKKVFSESNTDFDNQNSEFDVSETDLSNVNLQYCRILLWSKEELLRPESEAVIRFHEAFRIPLFFMDADGSNQYRDDDFIIIEGEDGGALCCCSSSRENDYRDAEAIASKATIRKLSARINGILGDERLLFAEDARELYKEKNHHH
jgi:hypothetical protein